MDVLIATWQAGGGAQAAIGLGRLLAERGHRTRLLAPTGYAARVAAAGCLHRPFPPELEWDPALGRRFKDQRAIMDRVFFGRDLADALVAELAVEPADIPRNRLPAPVGDRRRGAARGSRGAAHPHDLRLPRRRGRRRRC